MPKLLCSLRLHVGTGTKVSGWWSSASDQPSANRRLNQLKTGH